MTVMYGPFDKQLELRNIADGAEASTAAENGIDFDVGMAGDFKAIVYVSERAATGTCTISIETDSEAAFGDAPVAVASVTVAASTTGVFEMPLSAAQIARLDPDATAIRVNATLGGSSPSVTYGAYLAPAV
ncbi:hypothetical protein JT55_10215 [Rhodovulum sp. NI22]|nr:hypothetical protein JT55_10215 [Rhodovulum sp. NI22]